MGGADFLISTDAMIKASFRVRTLSHFLLYLKIIRIAVQK